jgi:hypothetical protein
MTSQANRAVSRAALLAALTVAIAGLNFGAHAAGSAADQAFQERLFGRALDAKPSHACFSRAYDPGHLAQHSKQNVRTMLLLVTGKAENGNDPSYQLGINVTFRKSGTHFESAGDCGALHDDGEAPAAGNVAHCGVDCDGGSIDVAIKGEKSVLVSIPAGARLWRAGSNGDDSGNARRKFGADNKVFRLDKAALTQCLGLANDKEEKAMMRRGQ